MNRLDLKSETRKVFSKGINVNYDYKVTKLLQHFFLKNSNFLITFFKARVHLFWRDGTEGKRGSERVPVVQTVMWFSGYVKNVLMYLQIIYVVICF